VAQGPRKKPLDFGSNWVQGTLWSGKVTFTVRWGTAKLRMGTRVTRRLFSCNNLATSEALAEVCAVMSAILVHINSAITNTTTTLLYHYYYYYYL